MSVYDPNDVGLKNGNLFSLPHQYDDASIVLVPVPWDVTTSYCDGTANGPEAILAASSQLDFYHPSGAKIWEYGVFMLPVHPTIKVRNKEMRKLAEAHIALLENDQFSSKNVAHTKNLEEVNAACLITKNEVKHAVLSALMDGKKVGLVGGDHGCALGMIEALAEQYKSFGILQIDAHADLRETYEGFTLSHASIFDNALQIKNIHSLTQVGIRDVSPNEAERIETDKRIHCFYDWEMNSALFKGKKWKKICDKIIDTLPQKVYISFDIDGLQPFLCPNTGTPVPGGLSFERAVYLIDRLVKSEKEIIGFDLCEVSEGEVSCDWNANVGARILFQLCTALHLSGN
jgi:agmatinase